MKYTVLIDLQRQCINSQNEPLGTSYSTLSSLRKRKVEEYQKLQEELQHLQTDPEIHSQKKQKTSPLNRLKTIHQGKQNKKTSSSTEKFKTVKHLFKVFVEANRMPTGRKRGKKFRLLSIFKQLKSPNWKGRQSMEPQSLQHHFNKLLKYCIEGKTITTSVSHISGSTVVRWFREMFPDTSLSPHPTDYCPTCAYMYNRLVSLKQQLTMLQRHGSSNKERVHQLETQIEDCEEQYCCHKKQVH